MKKSLIAQPWTISLIQGGAFETIESANEARGSLRNDGYAAVIDESEQAHLWEAENNLLQAFLLYKQIVS